MSGKADSADRIPARKDCPAMRRSGMCLRNRLATILLNDDFDRYSLSEKAKTGCFSPVSLALRNLFSDFIGQQLCPSKLKTCTFSPARFVAFRVSNMYHYRVTVEKCNV